MDWHTCFTADRHGSGEQISNQRTEFERDWDRLVFSSAFRRLQDKTQVFPLPDEIFVHNRLTHSLEVASVGRSLGAMAGEGLSALSSVKSRDDSRYFYAEHLKNVIASACLAHDMGNPAFGHSGESAISRYFRGREGDKDFRGRFSDSEWADLVSFEGNANALRVLTRNFKGRQEGGFQLTYPTLASILKYPCAAAQSQGKGGPRHRAKYGYFQSDSAVFEAITRRLHMQEDPGCPGSFFRHPFVYLTEAADDICYRIIDLEDAHRLGILPTSLTMTLLLDLLACLMNAGELGRIQTNLRRYSEDANEGIAYLRAKSISSLTRRCASIFLENEAAIIEGRFSGDLITGITEAGTALSEIEKISVEQIYNHSSVLKIELAGYRVMGGLVGDLTEAALSPRPDAMQRKTLGLIPAQYRYREDYPAYEKVMCILDFVSGMTDIFALKLYRNLRGIEIPTH
jgi:dGTPase